jgi:hypothetical protein
LKRNYMWGYANRVGCIPLIILVPRLTRPAALRTHFVAVTGRAVAAVPLVEVLAAALTVGPVSVPCAVQTVPSMSCSIV